MEAVGGGCGEVGGEVGREAGGGCGGWFIHDIIKRIWLSLFA